MLKPAQAYKTRTGTPEKYPQGRFKEKPCRRCAELFPPKAPSQLYCSTTCSAEAQQSAYYMRTYGISREDWTAMFTSQQGRCFICQDEGYTFAEHHTARLMVDHCHASGKVRGLLCHDCNRALGLFKDNRAALQRALDYLEGATTIP